MLLLNIIISIVALIFAFRGLRLFKHVYKHGSQEGAIALATVFMNTIVFTTMILIQFGTVHSPSAKLLLNYYVYVGILTVQFLICEFIIHFIYDKTKTTIKPGS